MFFKIQKLSFAEELENEEEEDHDDDEDTNEKTKPSTSSIKKLDDSTESYNDDSNSNVATKNRSDNGSSEGRKTESENDENSNSGNESKMSKKKRFGKNPNVDTSFLPDKDREAEEDALRLEKQKSF